MSAKLVTLLHLKTESHCSYDLALFKNFSVVAPILPIMVKLNTILRSECVSTWELRYSLGKDLIVMILPLETSFDLQSLA